MWRDIGGADIARHFAFIGIAGVALALTAAGLPSRAAAAQPLVIEGVWLTEKQSEMTIAPCGDDWCGYLTKIVVPPEIKAKYGDDLEKLNGNYTDVMNPDPALRDRPILGLRILLIKSTGSDNTFKGLIYNPEDGRDYDGRLKVIGTNTLRLEGCMMFGMMCQGENWQRIELPAAEVAQADGTPAADQVPAAN